MPPRPRFWVSWFLLIGVLVPRGVFGFRGAWATAKKKTGKNLEKFHVFSSVCSFPGHPQKQSGNYHRNVALAHYGNIGQSMKIIINLQEYSLLN